VFYKFSGNASFTAIVADGRTGQRFMQSYSSEPESSADKFLTNLREDVKRVIISQHVSVLRNYARKAVANNEQLDSDEYKDKGIRVKELITLGNSLNLTDKQIVTLLYRGLF
jgi:hypothetical protein